MTPVFVGDDPRTPAWPVPDEPGLLIAYWFCTVDAWRPEGTGWRNDIGSWRTWIARPEVSIDGMPVAAGWSGWWYPVPPGPHLVEVRSPAPATRRVNVPAKGRPLLAYRAYLSFCVDVGTDTVLAMGGTASLTQPLGG